MASSPGPRDLEGATVVFDLDGTLVDTAPDLAAATNFVLGRKGLAPVPLSKLHALIGLGSREMIKAGLAVHGARVDEEELTRLHELFLVYYADHVAVESRPFAHAREVVETLQARGARLAVCTNKVEHLSRLLLRTLEFDQPFAFVAGRDTFAVCKPDPGHLTMAVEAAGGSVKRAVMVGDSGVDIATARAAQVPCIAVTFGYTPVPVRELGADVVIDSFGDFMPALAQVLPR